MFDKNKFKPSKELYKLAIDDSSKKFGIKNPMMKPIIDCITVSSSIGERGSSKNDMEKLLTDLSLICQQKPLLVKAKKSIASFKMREGYPVGGKVTLRKNKMFSFLDRLVNIALPRSNDFRGLKKSSLDSNYNFTFGVKDYSIFSEIDSLSFSGKPFGLSVNISMINISNKDQAIDLLKSLGLPIY